MDLAPSVLSNADVDRVKFSVDPTAALSAPITEFVFFTLKEGKTVDMIAPDLDVLAGQDTKTVISSIWGQSVDRADRLVMLVGWESLEVRRYASGRIVLQQMLMMHRDELSRLIKKSSAIRQMISKPCSVAS